MRRAAPGEVAEEGGAQGSEEGASHSQEAKASGLPALHTLNSTLEIPIKTKSATHRSLFPKLVLLGRERSQSSFYLE